MTSLCGLRFLKKDPRLETLVEATGLLSSFRAVHTTSIRAEMVSFNLGIIVADCNSSGVSSSVNDWSASESNRIFAADDSEVIKATGKSGIDSTGSV